MDCDHQVDPRCRGKPTEHTVQRVPAKRRTAAGSKRALTTHTSMAHHVRWFHDRRAARCGSPKRATSRGCGPDSPLRDKLQALVRSSGPRRPLRSAHNLHAQFSPPIHLRVLHPDVVRSTSEPRGVHRRFVRRPVVDRKSAVDEHPNGVVADRAQRVLTRLQPSTRAIASAAKRDGGSPAIAGRYHM